MEPIKITEDRSEMEAIGRQIVEQEGRIYTPLMLSKIMERIEEGMPDASEEERLEMLYRSVYDFWVYGNNIDEEFYLRFYEKGHEEKLSYMVNRVRSVYVDHLCSGGGRERIDQLEMKYRAYLKLKPFYKREIIEISDESDYSEFEAFTSRHPVFVVKPSDYCYGIGVRKVDISEYPSARSAFDDILAEGVATKKRHPSRQSSVVVEELIEQCPELAALHPNSVNAIRATAVRDKDGDIRILHPWIKCGIGGGFVASAALDGGFDAEIDPDTGIVITDGYSENGNVYVTHPDSGIKIKGFRIPRWDDLKLTVHQLMDELPEYGYVGWDLVLTNDGWCVMEGNYSGEFTWQLIRGCGGRREFEEIIGWKMDKEFWWQIRPFPVSENS